MRSHKRKSRWCPLHTRPLHTAAGRGSTSPLQTPWVRHHWLVLSEWLTLINEG